MGGLNPTELVFLQEEEETRGWVYTKQKPHHNREKRRPSANQAVRTWEKSNLLTLRQQISRLLKYEKINFCSLSQLFCGILSWQPQQTKTNPINKSESCKPRFKELCSYCWNISSILTSQWTEFKFHINCLVAKLCSTLLGSRGLQPARLHCPWDFLGKNTGVGCHFLLQGIFSTQESNLSLLHWQADSLPLSHEGSHIIHPIYCLIKIKTDK